MKKVTRQSAVMQLKPTSSEINWPKAPVQPKRRSINAIIIDLVQLASEGMDELSMDELTYRIFDETQDKYFEPIKYAIGVLKSEAPVKYKDVIHKLQSVLPEWARD